MNSKKLLAMFMVVVMVAMSAVVVVAAEGEYALEKASYAVEEVVEIKAASFAPPHICDGWSELVWGPVWGWCGNANTHIYTWGIVGWINHPCSICGAVHPA